MKSGKRLYPLLGGLLLYGLAGFLLAPWLLERTLTNTLKGRLELQVDVEAIRINPFTLTLGIDALSLREPDGAALASFEQLFMNFELMSLFRWAWSFDEVHLIQPSIDFERFSEADNSFSRLAGRWSNSATAPWENEKSSDTDLIRLVVEDLKIVRGRVHLIDHLPAETFATELSPIDLSVANLSTLADSSGQQQVTITTESGARLAWTGVLSVNPISLSGQVTISGTHTPVLSRYFQEYLPVTLEGGDVEGQFHYALSRDDAGALSAHIENLQGTLQNLTIHQPDGTALAEIDAIDFSGGRLAWPERTAHVEELRFDVVNINAIRDATGSYLSGMSTADQPPATAETPTADETSTATATGTDAPAWQLDLARLILNDWRIRHTDQSLTNGTTEISDLDLTLGNISNQAGESISLDAKAVLAAGGLVSVSGNLLALPAIELDGRVQVTELALKVLQPYLSRVANIEIGSGSTSLMGTVVRKPGVPFDYRGDFRIDKLQLLDESQHETLLSFSELSIDQLALTPGSLEISELSLLELYARIEIERDGSTNIVRTLVDEPNPVSGPETLTGPSTTTADAEPFTLVIGKASVNDASARYTDLALPLPFEANISALSGTISTLSSTSSDAARIDFEGQVNEYGRVTIGGSLQPFAFDAETDIDISFENVNMSRVSPYTIKFAGRRLADGRTDLDLSYKVTNGTLEGSNRLVIRDLALGEKVESPDAMSLPLDLAVALLKDPSGIIDFDFPVSGELQDPQFSFAGAVGKAFSNIILNLVTSPFRLLGSLVGLKPEALESVAFLPGRSDLTPPQRETLDQLAEALTQRPQLQLEIPAVLDPESDRKAMQTAGVDTEIEHQLATQTADPAEAASLLAERRRSVIERLYDTAGLSPGRLELQQVHSPTDTEGTTNLDTLAYTEAMRRALIEATPISATELSTLADARVQSVIDELLASGALSLSRLTRTDQITIEADSDEQIAMPLNLSVGED